MVFNLWHWQKITLYADALTPTLLLTYPAAAAKWVKLMAAGASHAVNRLYPGADSWRFCAPLGTRTGQARLATSGGQPRSDLLLSKPLVGTPVDIQPHLGQVGRNEITVYTIIHSRGMGQPGGAGTGFPSSSTCSLVVPQAAFSCKEQVPCINASVPSPIPRLTSTTMPDAALSPFHTQTLLGYRTCMLP